MSKALHKEFNEYIQEYETAHGIQPIESIRILTREFAIRKVPLDLKAAQPIYWSLFATIYYKRMQHFNFPEDFNFDNPYDPDSIFLDDISIKNKLEKEEIEHRKRVLELIHHD
jgi:hypothetical protein